jgi:hypothetical protein
MWNPSMGRRIKVNRENLCKLFNAQRPKGDSKTSEETTGMLSIFLVDCPQYPLVRRV